MSPENPPARRWLRPRIWMWMVALPVIALAIVYWEGIGPFDRNPYWAALKGAQEWCASDVETFQPKGHFDWSKPGGESVQDEPGPLTLPCLVKISDIGRIQVARQNDPGGLLFGGGCYVFSYSLYQDGRRKVSAHLYSWAVQGSESTQSPAETAVCKKLVAALPSSQWSISVGNGIVVGFRDARGIWSTRLYDKSNLPPEVAALSAAMQINFR